MKKEDLRRKLDKLEVDPRYYSLDGKLLPDSLVLLNRNGSYFTVGLDERGGISDSEKKYNSEDEACMYIYMKLKSYIEFKRKFNIP